MNRLMSETIKALFELRDIVDVHPLRIFAFDSAVIPDSDTIIVFLSPEKYDTLGIDDERYPLWGYLYKDGIFTRVYEGVEEAPVFSLALGDFDGDGSLEIAMLQGPGSSIIMKRIEFGPEGISLVPVVADTRMDMQPSMEIQSFDIDKDKKSELMVVFADGTVKYYYSIDQKSTKDTITFGSVRIFDGSETMNDVVKATVDVSTHHNYVAFLASCGDNKVRVRTVYNNEVSNAIRELEFLNPVSAITAKMLDHGGFVAAAVDISGQAKILYYTSGKMQSWTENLLRIVDCGVFTADLISIHEVEGEEKLLLALGAGDGDVQFFIVEPNYEKPGSDETGMVTYLCDVKPSGRMILESRALKLPAIQESMIFYHLEGMGRESLQPLVIRGSPAAIHHAAMELFDGGTSWMKGLDTVEIIVRLGRATALWQQVAKVYTDSHIQKQAETIQTQVSGIIERVEKELVDDFSDVIEAELDGLGERIIQGQFAEIEKSITLIGRRLQETSRYASASRSSQLVNTFRTFCAAVFSTVSDALSAAMERCEQVLQERLDESEFISILDFVERGISIFPRVRDMLGSELQNREDERHLALLSALMELYERYRRKATLKRDTEPEECEAFRRMAIQFDESMKMLTKSLSDYYAIEEYHENVIANLAIDERVKCDEPRRGPLSVHARYTEADGRGEIVLISRNNDEINIGNLQVELVLQGEVASFEENLLRTSTLIKMGEVEPRGKKESDSIPVYGYTAGQVVIEVSGSYRRQSEAGTWVETSIPKREFTFGTISRVFGDRPLEDFVTHVKSAYPHQSFNQRGRTEGPTNLDRIREETEIALARSVAPFDAISLAPAILGRPPSDQTKFYILYPDNTKKSSLLEARIDLTERGVASVVWPKVEFYGPSSVQNDWERIRDDLTEYLNSLSEEYTRCAGCRSNIRNWEIDDKKLGSYSIEEIVQYSSDRLGHPELVRLVKMKDGKVARLQCPFCDTYNEVIIDEIV